MNAVVHRQTESSVTPDPEASNLQTSAAEPAPIQPDQEWANALTHGVAAKLSVFGGVALVIGALRYDAGMAVACAAYMASVFATFFASTLSHVFLRQPWLNTFRTWDQAMIYSMIVGTYTPIAYTYLDGALRTTTITLMWSAAAVGIISKVVFRHRINSISPIPYIMLGWIPAAILYSTTPLRIGGMMLAGGVFYSCGVYFLMNDSKVRYYHAIWHLFVITAAAIHYSGMWMLLSDWNSIG